MYWECDKKCVAGDDCKNHRFSKRQYADVKPFKTVWKGWGLQAGAGGILSGAFLMEYVGEVLDVHQCESRLKEYKSENRPLYVFDAICFVYTCRRLIDLSVSAGTFTS